MSEQSFKHEIELTEEQLRKIQDVLNRANVRYFFCIQDNSTKTGGKVICVAYKKTLEYNGITFVFKSEGWHE